MERPITLIITLNLIITMSLLKIKPINIETLEKCDDGEERWLWR